MIPRLVPALEIALRRLYSNDQPQLDAHDFLLEFQSRNPRRKLLSFKQSYLDNGKSFDNTTTSIQWGSSWLACIYMIICQMNYYYSNSERLFAAQTLLHRVRRTKLLEAVDLEFERTNDDEWTTTTTEQAIAFAEQQIHVIQPYIEWIPNPFIQQVLRTTQFSEDEELSKGQASLLTIIAILFVASSPHDSYPLRATLASTATTIALRVVYNPATLNNGDPKSLTGLLLESIHHVNSIANASSETLATVLHLCLVALPDTILGSPGGARGRLSLDPRCIQAATQELRQHGVHQLASSLNQILQSPHGEIWALSTCERWGKYLLLPRDFLLETLVLAKKHLNSQNHEHQRTSFSYLIAIFEAGAWDIDQVLKVSLGRTEANQNEPVGKKRQSSRAKKREKESLDRRKSDENLQDLEYEVYQRGENACVALEMVWDELDHAVEKAIQSNQVDGEGPIGCLTIAANTYFPFCVTHRRWSDHLVRLSMTFRKLCRSHDRNIRALCLEPLHTLHTALLSSLKAKGELDHQIESLVVDHLVESALGLAGSCGYPDGYFNDMTIDSDHDLEVERNDVRDVIRSVSCSIDGGSTSDVDASTPPARVTFMVLARLVESCLNSVSRCKESEVLVPETVVHLFSSLAKPLNHSSIFYLKSPDKHDDLRYVLLKAIEILSHLNEQCVLGFKKYHLSQVFAVSRLVNIGTASLAPTLSAIEQTQEKDFHDMLVKTLSITIEASIQSILVIPELAALSTLDCTQYNIRGAMCSPGGEDHVGCLALARLSTESPKLARSFASVAHPSVEQLCKLHQHLKEVEIQRGRGVLHGVGVGPKSRRLLLQVICQIHIASEGNAGTGPLLEDLFQKSVDVVHNSRSMPDDVRFYHLTEAISDLASFSPIMLLHLFEDEKNEHAMSALETMTHACLFGYENAHVLSEESLSDWSRLRGAMHGFLLSSSTLHRNHLASVMLISLVRGECDAISKQCALGPQSPTLLFGDEIVSPDSTPSGLFVKTILDIFSATNSHEVREECIVVLQKICPTILQTLLLECPATQNFEDPRQCLLEAWLLAITSMPRDDRLLVDTCATACILISGKSLAQTQAEREYDPYLSFDGPHSLALMDFFVLFAQSNLLSSLGKSLEEQLSIPDGIAFFAGVIFRCFQGALPPYTVERLSDFFEALSIATPAEFREFLHRGMTVPYRGQLVAGTLRKIPDFLEEATDAYCRQDFRRVKVLVKQLCGGKKHGSDFKTKPAPTRWTNSLELPKTV